MAKKVKKQKEKKEAKKVFKNTEATPAEIDNTFSTTLKEAPQQKEEEQNKQTPKAITQNIVENNSIEQLGEILKNDINTPIETIIFQTSLCKVVEVEELDKESNIQKIQYIYANIEGVDYKAKIPFWFKIDNNGYLYGFKQEKIGIVSVFLSDYILFPILIMEDVLNLQESIKLAIFKRDKWVTLMLPKNLIYVRPIKLTQYGVKIASENNGILSQFFMDFELENNIPKKSITSKLGWYNNYTEFVPYSENIQFSMEDMNSHISDNSYSTNGNLENWKQTISSFRNNNIFRFILAGAFASPLLKILNERPFIIYNYASSRSRKNSSLKMCNVLLGKSTGAN